MPQTDPNTSLDDYYRRDQADGVTAPDLSKDCSFAEHIVRARGKRTQMTSVSRDPAKIHDFGPSLYMVLRDVLRGGGHDLVEHAELIERLREAAQAGQKDERTRAVQALRYAKRRCEGIIRWNFSLANVDRSDLITWAFRNVQRYFRKA